MSAAGIEQQVGRVVGEKYVLERQLGQGGFGALFVARRRDLDATVAVKIRLPVRHGPNSEARFRREAATLAALRHPNIVEMLDYGQEPDGLQYLVLELLPGSDLSALMGAGALPWRRAAYLCRQVAAALAAAHQRGIVHRDLKPANIRVADLPGAPDHVKVMDFGIAKLLAAAASVGGDDEPQTAVGMVLGTPTYFSPEQCTGDPSIGPASDLYSLGVVLYEMLSGAPPFVGATPHDLAAAHVSALVPALQVPSPLELAPPALQTLVGRLLAKRAQDRPPDALALLAELDRLLGAPSGETQAHARSAAPSPASPPEAADAPPPSPALAATDLDPALDDEATTLAVAAYAAKPAVPGEAGATRVPPRRGRVALFAVLGLTVALGAAAAGLLAGGLGSESERAAQLPGPAAPLPTDAGHDAAAVTPLRLAIDSEPAGAEVWLGGQRLGTTPLRVERSQPAAELLRPGDYTLRLAGHRLASFSLRHVVDDGGQVVRGEARLVPDPPPPSEAPAAPPAPTARSSRRRSHPPASTPRPKPTPPPARAGGILEVDDSL